MTVRHDGLSVTWFGYATVRIESPDGFVAYLDPGRYGVLEDYWGKDGDLVCVTHDHHYDSDAIERVADPEATVVVYERVDAARIDRDVTPVSELPYDVRRVAEEDYVRVDGPDGGVDVWTVPAYNDPDGPHADAGGSVSHPRGLGVGFLVSVAGVPVFWPGDGDALDAYANLEVSLYLANIGGTVVSNEAESASLAEAMAPDLVLPVHYDTIPLLEADADAFVTDVARRGIPVVLDERGPE